MIRVPKKLLAEIRAHGERSFPNECCGIVFGTIDEDGADGLKSKKTATELRSIENEFDDGEKYHRFLITEGQMLSAELYARKNKLEIVGIYHSHPDCASIPSEYDRSHAVPMYSYLITSILKGKAADVQNWTLVWDEAKGDNAFTAEMLEETD